MTVRSAQLAAVSSATANAQVVVYTCPSGTRTIVKDITFYSLATVPGTIYVVLKCAGVSVAVILISAGVRLQLYRLATAFYVLNAGDTIEAFAASTTGGNWILTAGGAELAV